MARLLWNFCAALLGLASLPSVLAASWWKPNATEGLGFNYQLGTSFSSNFYSGVQASAGQRRHRSPGHRVRRAACADPAPQQA